MAKTSKRSKSVNLSADLEPLSSEELAALPDGSLVDFERLDGYPEWWPFSCAALWAVLPSLGAWRRAVGDAQCRVFAARLGVGGFPDPEHLAALGLEHGALADMVNAPERLMAVLCSGAVPARASVRQPLMSGPSGLDDQWAYILGRDDGRRDIDAREWMDRRWRSQSEGEPFAVLYDKNQGGHLGGTAFMACTFHAPELRRAFPKPDDPGMWEALAAEWDVKAETANAIVAELPGPERGRHARVARAIAKHGRVGTDNPAYRYAVAVLNNDIAAADDHSKYESMRSAVRRAKG